MAKQYQGDYSHDYKVRAYSLDYKPGETDLQYYKRLAKVADQRLVRLEKLAGIYKNPKTGQTEPGIEGYEKVTNYAYDRAMRDLEVYGGGTRFNTKPPLNPDGTVDNRLLSEKLADIRTFLSSVTSTKQGIESVYSERAKTLNEKFDTNFTWQDMADFYQSGEAAKLNKSINSDLVLRAIGVIQKAESKMEKEVKENNKITMNKRTDKLVYKQALKFLEGNDLKLSILKGKNAKDIAKLKRYVEQMQREENKKESKK